MVCAPALAFLGLRGLHDIGWHCRLYSTTPSSLALGSRPESDSSVLAGDVAARFLRSLGFRVLLVLRRASHEVPGPFDACGIGQRPAPGLPHPTVLRPQALSASRRFIPSETSPALFRAGSALGIPTFRGSESYPIAVPASRRSLSLLPFSPPTLASPPLAGRVGSPRWPRLQGLTHSGSPAIPGRMLLRVQGRASLGVASPRSCPLRSWPRRSEASSHGLRHLPGAVARSVSMSALQSVKEPEACPASFKTVLPP